MRRMSMAVAGLVALAANAGAQEMTHGLARDLGFRYSLPIGSKFNEVTVVGPKGHLKINPRKGKATVFIFVSNTCGYSKGYDRYMHVLHDEFVSQGVQFAFLDGNEEDGPGEAGPNDPGTWVHLTTDTTWTNLPPVFLDSLSEVANMLGALNTPEAFIFDSTGTLRYRGALTEKEDLTKDYARWALQAIVAGKPVAIPQTPTFGCSEHPSTPDGYGEQ